MMFPKAQKARKYKLPNYLRTGSKFNNAISQYNGKTYHSRLEAEYAMILDDMKRKKEIKKWEGQFKLKLDVNGHHITNYLADFLVTMPDNSQQIHETKGYFTPIGTLKWRLAQALYADTYKFILIKG